MSSGNQGMSSEMGAAAAVQQLMAAAAQSGRRSLDASTAQLKRMENPAIANARWIYSDGQVENMIDQGDCVYTGGCHCLHEIGGTGQYASYPFCGLALYCSLATCLHNIKVASLLLH